MAKIFDDVEVLWISRFDYEQHWYLKDHGHEDFYQLIYMAQGECLLRLDGVETEVKAPSLLFLRPGTRHGISKVLSPNLVTLDIKFAINNDDLVRAASSIPALSVPRTDEVKTLLEQIRDQGMLKPTWYQEQCRLLLGQLLLTLFRWADRGKVKGHQGPTVSLQRDRKNVSPLTSDMLDFLEEASLGSFQTTDLENHFHHSYRYLSGVFRHDMMMTPMAYREKLRVARSKELMSYTSFELKEICELAGYQDIHQFTKSFKKEEGVPPGHWREALQHHIRKDICIHPEFKNELQVEERNE